MKKNLIITSSEMNVIWKKDKLQKYSRESIRSPLASGDGVELHCRLCGASDHLQRITNERLDETLRLYFGVQVPPEGMICESCIKCMKITEGFSALVHASFDKPVSQDSSRHTRILADFSPGATNLPATNPQKEILSLLNAKLTLDAPKRRERRRAVKKNSKVVFKKMIIECTVCGQKYPMFMPEDSTKKFICSRCQKKSCNDSKKYMKSSANKIELHCKIDLRSKNRLNSLPKKPQQVKQDNSAIKYDHPKKFQCSQCSKKYAIAENLATHVKVVHDDSNFKCTVGGKKLKTKEFLLSGHMGVKNVHCESVRVTKSTLQSHSVYHEKQKVKSFSS